MPIRPFELDFDLPQGNPGHCADVRLRGYLDAQAVPRLEGARARILEAGSVHVILDLEELDYISSAGMGSIMAFFQELRRRKGGMVLVRPSRRVMDLLNILGFAKLFPIVGSRTEADDFLAELRRT